jgi:outer membrane PBP1 activator LpoA protein
MKKQMVASLIIRSVLVSTVILATGFLSGCSGHRPGADQASMSSAPSQTVASEREKSMAEAKMMDRCMEMATMKKKMMADMKAQDAELTAQVARMNKAPKNEKVKLMAALLTSMVEQRTAMHAGMEKMQGEMMQHMMQHMQMGRESMMKCPMMTDMEGKPMDTHKGH